MKSVTRIEAKFPENKTEIGTGFSYHFHIKKYDTFIPAIITNRHAVEGAISLSFPISVADSDGTPHDKFEIINYEFTPQQIIYHPDPNVDLCAILTSPIHQYFREKNQQPALFHLTSELTATDNYFEELLPLEDVTMIGFPHGLWDSTNNGSIARKGVIATIPGNDYLGKKEFVIDMACFPGSSGSPVFLVNIGQYFNKNSDLIMGNRIKLLGILYGGPQYNAHTTVGNDKLFALVPNNLGYVIKATELNILEELANKTYDHQNISHNVKFTEH